MVLDYNEEDHILDFNDPVDDYIDSLEGDCWCANETGTWKDLGINPYDMMEDY
jgi:hypothetical protein